MRLYLTLVLMVWPIIGKAQDQMNEEEQKALEFVTKSEGELEKVAQNFIVLAWAYDSNITDYNEKRKLDYEVHLIKNAQRMAI
jgi:hypothetical protein